MRTVEDLTDEQRRYLDGRFSYLKEATNDLVYILERKNGAVDSDESNVDTELLLEVYRWAELQDSRANRGLPSEWDQETWVDESRDTSCGTSCCIAGYVALHHAPKNKIVGLLADSFDPDHDNGDFLVTINDEGMVVSYGEHVSDYAAERLGLNEEQENLLFSGANKLHDIRMLVEIFTGETLS